MYLLQDKMVMHISNAMVIADAQGLRGVYSEPFKIGYRVIAGSKNYRRTRATTLLSFVSVTTTTY